MKRNQDRKRTYVIGLLLGAFTSSGNAGASGTAYGTLSNFDVYNDTGSLTHGFEIELEDIAATSVPYTYASQRYGAPTKAQFVDASNKIHTIVKYESPYVNQTFTKSTQPATSMPPTTGHSCIVYTDCEHFGVSLIGNPSATHYYWLVPDPTSPGTLARGAAVNLPAPVWNVIPAPAPQQPPLVQAVVVPREQEPEELVPPPPVWVKVYKTEMKAGEEAVLNDLMSDNPKVPHEAAEVESEWELLEAGKALEVDDDAAEDSKQIIRRYEYYKYTGALTLENEAICLDGFCSSPGEGELGPFIGSQMAAINLDPVAVPPPEPVPVPATVSLLLSGIGACGVLRRFMKTWRG